ncbi:hypothetical protein GCM10011329_13280 [Stakelama pacifica]|nr:hypothetical protein GCM10011329_13280 [Stakelama pacifica]
MGIVSDKKKRSEAEAMKGRRVAMLVILPGLFAVAAMRHPSADISILTHDRSDPSPHRVQAGLDLGIAAFSLLVTWTANQRHA